MDNLFQRTRRPPQNPDAPTIRFIVHRKAADQLDRAADTSDAWKSYEKRLQFRPCRVTFRRIPNRKKPDEPLWNAYWDLPEGGGCLRFAIVPSNSGFFVLGITPDAKKPDADGHSMEIELIPEFPAENSRGYDSSQDYPRLLGELMSLKITREFGNRAAKDEIENWNKYLQALEKVTKDKTVLLPVVWKDNRNMRGKGFVMRFELDWMRWMEGRMMALDDLPGLSGLVHREETPGRVSLHWVDKPEWDPETMAGVEAVMEDACLQWTVPPSAPRWLLHLKIKPRYGTAESRERRLRELDSSLRARGLTVSREGGRYTWGTWADYHQWLAATEAGKSIWARGEAPLVELRLCHPLNEAPGRQVATRLLVQSLTRDGADIRPAPGDGLVTFALPAGRSWTNPDEWAWGLVHVLLVAHVPVLPSADQNEKGEPLPDPKWVGTHGVVREGGQVRLKAPDSPSLRKNYEALRLANPRFQFPEWEALQIEHQVGLRIQLQPKAWWEPIWKGIEKIGGIRINGMDLSLHPRTQAEADKVCERIQALQAELTVAHLGLRSELQFLQENPKAQQEALDRGVKRLAMQFGEDVTTTPGKGEVDVLLRRPSAQHIDSVTRSLESVCGEEMDYVMDRPEGLFETVMEPDQKARMAWAEECWPRLRGCTMKFLSESEQAEYLKEIEGKGGKYHGGQELGRLRSFRGGNPEVILEEEMEAPEVPPLGWLLPMFIGDLAQIARLKAAMRLLIHPEGGLPVNRRLGQFIFEPGRAHPIPPGIDVQSDRDWQLKHALINRGLNEMQREAVWKALHAEDLMLVQGPPGTGKTTVIAEIVWQVLQEDPSRRILISSQSHLAVDNALERLSKQNLIRPLRIAARSGKQVEPEGRVYFAEVIEAWAKAPHGSPEHQENADNAVSRWMKRILGDVQHQEKFAQAQQRWRELLSKPTPDIKSFMKGIYLDNVNVVAATCLECGNRDFKDRYEEEGFDYVIVDEASKATPPELMVPLILAKRVIIIGDHRQLPPMLDERELQEVLVEIGEKKLAAEIDAFKVSQFEKLFMGIDPSLHVTLRIQYRMHEDIMRVINPFYHEEGGLECGITAEMDVPDLSLRGSRWHGLSHAQLLSPDDHLVWVEVNSPEIAHHPGYSNDGEVEAVRRVMECLVGSAGWREYDGHFKCEEDREIGIISFYGKQVEKLREVVEEFRKRVPIRLRTVDKFQGMERNIMIVSTVRSDTQLREDAQQGSPARPNTDIGFAKDYRRVNVAFSRARRLLIIVGNEGHFADNHEIYGEIRKIVGRYGQRLDIKAIPKIKS
ncbi:MAG: hypothetical protein RLZZ165_544 [Bacteroidota bacterium]